MEIESGDGRQKLVSDLVNPLLTVALTNDVANATALYNESLTYLRLASDHAKFIRNYFDPTQERLFRMADAFAASLDSCGRTFA